MPRMENAILLARYRSNYGSDTAHWRSVNKHGQVNRPICTHYGLTGCTVDKCCKLHGYPLGSNLNTTTYKACSG